MRRVFLSKHPHLRVGSLKFKPHKLGQGQLVVTSEEDLELVQGCSSFNFGHIWEVTEGEEPAAPPSVESDAGAAPAAPASSQYDEMSYKALRALLKERGITIPTDRKKAALVAKLVTADVAKLVNAYQE